jgi:hypothetical protein
MVDLVNIPAIDGIENAADARLVLYQSGTLVHTPLQQIIDILAEVISDITGEGLLLEGDEYGLGLSFMKLEGDESGILLLE